MRRKNFFIFLFFICHTATHPLKAPVYGQMRVVADVWQVAANSRKMAKIEKSYSITGSPV